MPRLSSLFAPSLVGLRFFAALSQSIVLVIAGLIARDLGGNRHAQILAAVAFCLLFFLGTFRAEQASGR